MTTRKHAPDAYAVRPLRIAADALWVASFAFWWGLLLAFWNTLLAIPAFLLFLGHLGGISEFVHQTVHYNLFGRSKFWNRALGSIAAGMISVDFDTYREFHLGHHRFANSEKDPERVFYKDPAFLAFSEGWGQLTDGGKVLRTLRLAKHFAAALASFGGDKPFVRTVRWSVPVLIVAVSWLLGTPLLLLPVKLVVTWYLPLTLLLFLDMAFAQSEHYATPDVQGVGSKELVPYTLQYNVSWNLRFPKPIEFLLLRRNTHAEHHLSPGIHWTAAGDQGLGRELGFGEYLQLLWTKGPRT